MHTKQDNRSNKSCIRSIDSASTSTTREPVYYPPVVTAMENPFQRLDNKLYEITRMLGILLENQSKNVEKSDLIGLKEACEMLQLSSSSIYKMTANNTIPRIKREGSKKLIFSRSQLDTWLKEFQSNHTSMINRVDDHLHKNLRIRRIQNN